MLIGGLTMEKCQLSEKKSSFDKISRALRKTTGAPPKGWYYGRLSPSSVRLVYDVYKEMKLPLLYSSDTYSDDLPYWQPVPGTDDAILMIPYDLFLKLCRY